MKGNKRIVTVFLAGLFLVLVAAAPPGVAERPFLVVLDAGHGGKDPGNLGTGRYKRTEKDISLDVTLLVGKYIEENIPQIKIIYTRKGDSYPTLKDRVEIANNAQADLFISIHCNSAAKTAAGTETFVMGMHKTEESLRSAMRENASIFLEENYEENYAGFDPKDPDTYIALSLRQNIHLDHSLFLSKLIQDQFRERVGRKDRGVKQAGHYVTSFTTMPSALVELGFLTNEEEEDFLHSEKGQSFMASAIYRAFKEYKSQLDGIEAGKGSTPTPEPEKEVEKPAASSTTEKQGAQAASGSSLIIEDTGNGPAYRIQIMTSSTPVEKTPSNFNGLEQVDEYFSDGLYKYLAGKTNTYKEARKNLETIKAMGFAGAFIIAFKGPERIDLQSALSLENQ